MSHRRISLDARLLGSRSRRIFLDSQLMGRASASWSALDARLLGDSRASNPMAGMPAIGDHTLDSTAELITASATAPQLSWADVGKVEPFNSTPPRGTWAQGFTAFTRIAPYISHVSVNNHYSFNGEGGVRFRPNAEERAAMHRRHDAHTQEQMAHQRSRPGRPQQLCVGKPRESVSPGGDGCERPTGSPAESHESGEYAPAS